MPKVSTRDTLLRQWEILQLLPHGGAGKTHSDILKELHEEGYTVTKRTVERDLEQLYEAFPTQIERNDKSKPWGWRWVYGASANIPGISITEALSTELIKNTLRPLLPAAILKPMEPRFSQAAARLKQERTSNQIANWSEKVYQIDPTMPLLAPTIENDVLEAVQMALMAEKQLEVKYQSMESEEAVARTLHPLGLVQRGPISYLIATAYNYDDVLIWALHRMSKAEVTPEKRHIPDGFTLDEYVKSGKLHFGSTKPTKLKAYITNDLARILSESPLSIDQKITLKNDTYTLSATVADTWQLHWWILSQGTEIEVLGPSSLRNSIAKTLRDSAAQYIE